MRSMVFSHHRPSVTGMICVVITIEYCPTYLRHRGGLLYTVSQITKQGYFCHNFVKISTNCDNFGTKMVNRLELLTYANTLSCICSKLSHNAV